MLFPSKEARELQLAIGRAMQRGTIGEAEAGERLLKLDPHSGAAYLALGKARLAAGDLDGAEAFFWQGIDRKPCEYPLYMALSDVRRARDPNDPLAAQLRMLGIWKLSLAEEIPDMIADAFRAKSKRLNFKDPETYEMLATAYEVQEKDTVDPPEVQDRLLPYRLLNDLQRQGPIVVASQLLHGIIANSERCLPLWRAALREWGKNQSAVSTKALALILALLGEIAGIDVLDELLDLATFNDAVIFLHTHWAIWRIGQRFPAETLAKFRAATAAAPLALRCGLAEQINLLPELEGIGPALIALLEGFSGYTNHVDAPYLLMVAVYALAELGLEQKSIQVFERYSVMLPKKGRQTLQAYTSDEQEFVPKLMGHEIDAFDIEDVVLHRALMKDEEREDSDEEDLDEVDWDEQTSDDEESSEAEARRVKLGRNDPCWCGSGKKYKKCHLAADEEAERGRG